MNNVKVMIPGDQAKNVAGRWVDATVIEERPNGYKVEVPSWVGQGGSRTIFLRKKFVKTVDND